MSEIKNFLIAITETTVGQILFILILLAIGYGCAYAISVFFCLIEQDGKQYLYVFTM